MKKIFFIIAALVLGCTVASAQDFAKATELAKQANEALINSDYNTAIANFEAAMKEAVESTEEGAADLVNNCKKGIAQAKYSLVNEYIEAGKMKEAIEKLDDAIATATEYGETELVEKAQAKKHQVQMAAANAKVKAAAATKDAAEKAAHLQEALGYLDALTEADNTDVKAFMLKGQVYGQMGKSDDAVKAFLQAKELGAKDADKQLSNIYVKLASANLKAQDYKKAVENAQASIDYKANPNAYKIAGVASQKLGDLAGAVDYLGKYLELRPEDEQIKQAVTALKAQLNK